MSPVRKMLKPNLTKIRKFEKKLISKEQHFKVILEVAKVAVAIPYLTSMRSYKVAIMKN